MSYFADILKQLRLERGLTQSALAKELQVTQNAVFNWENRKREPNIDMIRKIADYFQVSTAYLVEGKDSYERMLGYLRAFANGKLSTTSTPPSTDSDILSIDNAEQLLTVEIEYEKAQNYYDYLMAYNKMFFEWYQKTCAPLNDEGQKKVIEYAEALSETNKYQRQPNKPA